MNEKNNKKVGDNMSDLKIKELSYRRVHNLGNYETEALEVIAVVNETDDPEKIYDAMKRFTENKLFG
jgi:CO dehydrogenase/acetyl-CoA synthase gamma subunit (corrinoid Fe-S protein)